MARFTLLHTLDLDRGTDERISDCCRSDDMLPRDLLQRFTLHVLTTHRLPLFRFVSLQGDKRVAERCS